MWVILLTTGNVCTVWLECVSLMAGTKKLLGDEAYDCDSFRRSLRQECITPVIPAGQIARKACVNKEASGRNVIERCYCGTRAVPALLKGRTTPGRSMHRALQQFASNCRCRSILT
jgi:hypothetical protein